MSRITRLESLSDERLDVYARLTDHQLRARVEAQRGVLVAESRLVVDVALDAGVRPVSFLVDERQASSCAGLLDRAGDDVPAFVLPSTRLVSWLISARTSPPSSPSKACGSMLSLAPSNSS